MRFKNGGFKGDSKLADKCHTVTFSDPDKRPPELRDSSRSARRVSLPGIVIILAYNWGVCIDIIMRGVWMGRAKVDSGEAVGASRSLGRRSRKSSPEDNNNQPRHRPHHRRKRDQPWLIASGRRSRCFNAFATPTPRAFPGCNSRHAASNRPLLSERVNRNRANLFTGHLIRLLSQALDWKDG